MKQFIGSESDAKPLFVLNTIQRMYFQSFSDVPIQVQCTGTEQFMLHQASINLDSVSEKSRIQNKALDSGFY